MKLRIAGAVVCVVSIAAIIFVFFFSPRRQPPVLPSPNGYDDLLKIVPSIVPNPGNWRTQGIAELRTILNPNSNALATIRGALKKEWAVPVAYNTNYLLLMYSNLATPKVLANLFCAEGHLAELEQRTNEALNAFADCIQLGQKATHGALIIHDLVGIACKAIGRQAAQTIWPAADDASLQVFLNRLTEIDQSNQPAEEVIRRDHEWAHAAYGLKYAWASLVQRSAVRASEESLRAKHSRSEAEMRLLRTDVAIELFRRKNLRYPNILSEVVPEYLDAVPFDPFTGKPMLYRTTTNSYLLYSAGPDKKDDGGTPLTKSSRAAAQVSLYFETDPDKGDLISIPPVRR